LAKLALAFGRLYILRLVGRSLSFPHRLFDHGRLFDRIASGQWMYTGAAALDIIIIFNWSRSPVSVS
jgi:hypothetical protein